MWIAQLTTADDFESWRAIARQLAIADVPADQIVWQIGEAPADLFGSGANQAVRNVETPAFAVPRSFVELARDAICHSDPERFALLYAFLGRLRANPLLIEDRSDPFLHRLHTMARQVRRDIHKMRAFLRFREIGEPAARRFVAWFEPDHHIVRANAGFFVDRFASMHWSILTPELSLHWDGQSLQEAPGAVCADAPSGDPLEETWRTYYASIFNPARMKVGAMLREMPRKYWKNMPETALVPSLIASAQARESAMVAASRETLSSNVAGSWEALREEANGCTRCPLYKNATQTVFGEGPLDAKLMFVGEQPGDQEDIAGRPFVGPAGQLFDAALDKAGIDRSTVYVTNAVKHFKFELRGKKRIHSKPGAGEIEACRWWIEHERELIRPPVTVALGATAANSLFGKSMAIGKNRGAALELPDGSECWITVHPSFLLRIPEEDRRREERALFVRDLKRIKARAAELAR